MLSGKPTAAFVCPGHPLLDATIDMILERYRDLLKRGVTLVDPQDRSDGVRTLFYLEHSIQDARTDKQGDRRLVSRRMQFVEMDEQGSVRDAGYAPYLDYRPMTDEERAAVAQLLDADWLRGDLESAVMAYAGRESGAAAPGRGPPRKEEMVRKTMAAVNDRLTKEINYWDRRAEPTEGAGAGGQAEARINSGLARQRADELESRLQAPMEELEQERRLSPLPPVIAGGALVVPQALLKRADGAGADGGRAADGRRRAAHRTSGRGGSDGGRAPAAARADGDGRTRIPATISSRRTRTSQTLLLHRSEGKGMASRR